MSSCHFSHCSLKNMPCNETRIKYLSGGIAHSKCRAVYDGEQCNIMQRRVRGDLIVFVVWGNYRLLNGKLRDRFRGMRRFTRLLNYI